MYFCGILILVLVIVFSGLQILESTVFYENQNLEDPVKTKTIVRDGVAYFPRQNITVLMILGVDNFGKVESSGFHQNEGAADMVMLMIFDEKDQSISVLNLNRDTMLEMPVLGLGGRPAGTFFGQLALSHTYGSGLEDSCENTRTAVSDFLYGLRIDHYVAMNMDAIAIFNDAVGGVPVTVEDDFSQVDPTITKGEMILRGEQSIHFVRSRRGVGDQLNLTRLERQEEYMRGFISSLQAKLDQGEEFILSAYEEASAYLVTNCSINTMSSMVNRYGDYELRELLTLPGKNTMGDQYYEFYADEAQLDALILRLFYAPKQ